MEPEQKSNGHVELMIGQLLIIVIAGILLSIGAGYWLGQQIGTANSLSTAVVQTPGYCNVDRIGDGFHVKCNELGNVSLDNLCKWASPELKDKIKLVIIT